MKSDCNSRFITSWLLTCLLVLVTPQATASEKAVWEAFNNGNAIALMRHALAPGNGDPAEFDVNDCDTQRNLSAAGVSQAQQIGLQMKKHGITQAQIYTSHWCRCFDTAVNLDLGPVQKWPVLNSFYQNRSTEEAQTTQLTTWVLDRLSNENTSKTNDEPTNKPALLVTHQVNITALTGVFPSSGEVVFVALENDQLTVLSSWLAEN